MRLVYLFIYFYCTSSASRSEITELKEQTLTSSSYKFSRTYNPVKWINTLYHCSLHHHVPLFLYPSRKIVKKKKKN